MIVAGTSDLTPALLLEGLHQIEREIGKPLSYERWSPRVIDLDILMWRDMIVETSTLTIPHPELKNRPFLTHLIAMMDISYKRDLTKQRCFSKSYTLAPQLVGIVNITHDSFSDGGVYNTVDKATQHALKLSEEGAHVVEIGAQSTKPGVSLQCEEEEYERLEPVLKNLKPFLEKKTLLLSVDTFRPALIRKILKNYPISWINDVTGNLDDDILQLILDHQCSLVIMHSLGIPPQHDNILPQTQSPLLPILKWAKRKIDHLQEMGFKQEKIILDPGIGYGKSAYQNLEILRDLDALKELGVPLLMGHSRKLYTESFSMETAQNRDIETLAISGLIAKNIDYLRVHNVRDHMRFFVAQQALKGGIA